MPADAIQSKLHAVFVALAIAGGIGALALPWLPASRALSHFVIDDCGYYLTAAANVLHGRGATLDGHSATNGFHPLWLVSVMAVEFLVGRRPVVVFHLVLALCAGLFVLTGLVLCRKVYETAGWLAAPFAAWFFFNYRLASIALGGLESALAGLSVVLAAVAVSQWAGALTARRAVALGALLGAATLARMDALLFSAVALSWLAICGFHKRSREHVALAVMTGAVWALTLVPWMFFSWRTVHGLFPRSGVALLQFSPSPWNRPWDLERLTRAFRGSVVNPAGNIANIVGVWPLINGPGLSRLAGAAALGLAVCGFVFLTWRSRNDPAVKPLLWLWVYALLHSAYYLQFSSNPRYLYPPILVLSYVAAVVTTAAARRARRTDFRVRVLGAAVVMSMFTTAAGIQAYAAGFGSGYTHGMIAAVYEDTVPWVAQHTAPSATLGAFNGGILSYFSNRIVVDLDGVMNERAIEAIGAGRLCSYVAEEHIDYLVDTPEAITFFFDRDASCRAANWRQQWTTLHTTTWSSPKGGTLDWVVMQRAEQAHQ